MCSNLFLQIREYQFFLTFFFWRVCKISNKDLKFKKKQRLSSAHLKQAPVPGCRHSSCMLIVHVCLCVCACVCACENV